MRRPCCRSRSRDRGGQLPAGGWTRCEHRRHERPDVRVVVGQAQDVAELVRQHGHKVDPSGARRSGGRPAPTGRIDVEADHAAVGLAERRIREVGHHDRDPIEAAGVAARPRPDLAGRVEGGRHVIRRERLRARRVRGRRGGDQSGRTPSSSMIVTVPVRPAIVAPDGFESTTLNCSVGSVVLLFTMLIGRGPASRRARTSGSPSLVW